MTGRIMRLPPEKEPSEANHSEREGDARELPWPRMQDTVENASKETVPSLAIFFV